MPGPRGPLGGGAELCFPEGVAAAKWAARRTNEPASELLLARRATVARGEAHRDSSIGCSALRRAAPPSPARSRSGRAHWPVARQHHNGCVEHCKLEASTLKANSHTQTDQCFLAVLTFHCHCPRRRSAILRRSAHAPRERQDKGFGRTTDGPKSEERGARSEKRTASEQQAPSLRAALGPAGNECCCRPLSALHWAKRFVVSAAACGGGRSQRQTAGSSLTRGGRSDAGTAIVSALCNKSAQLPAARSDKVQQRIARVRAHGDTHSNRQRTGGLIHVALWHWFGLRQQRRR